MTLTYIRLFHIFVVGIPLIEELLLINLEPEYLKHSVEHKAL